MFKAYKSDSYYLKKRKDVFSGKTSPHVGLGAQRVIQVEIINAHV